MLENTRKSAHLDRAPQTHAATMRAWPIAAAGTAFVVIAALLCIDYLASAPSRDVRLHAAIELMLMAVAVMAAAVAWWRFVVIRGRERVLIVDLDRARAEAERWKREAGEVLRGLGAAIDAQFGRWGLSTAEREVALLLLKGLAHKDIAEVRGTSEKTVRQQALALYRKAGLSGRAELSAFFLEDLLLPVRADRGLEPGDRA